MLIVEFLLIFDLFSVLCVVACVGCRAFAVHGPMVWNSLPDDLRTQQDYESFRQGLKTWLFSGY